MGGEDDRQVSLISILENSDQPEVLTPGQLVDKINQIDFASQAAKTAALLLVGEAIKLQSGKLQIDSEAAKVVLSSQESDTHSVQTEYDLAGEEKIERSGDLNSEELRTSFQVAVERMVEGGVMSADFSQQVERLLALEDVRQVPGRYARFVYEGDGFPRSDQDRGYIEVGDQMIGIYTEKIKKIAQRHNIPLTDQQCSAVAFQVVLLHEYGHAALQTKKAAEIERRKAGGEETGFEMVVAVDKQINGLVANQVASSPELKELFAQEPVDELITVDERVAGGFEMLALWNGLREVGATQEQIELIVQTYFQEKKDQSEEKKKIIMFAQSKGIGLRQLDGAIQELFMSLRKTEPVLAEKCRGGFGPQTLGYDFPLSPSELTQLCKNET